MIQPFCKAFLELLISRHSRISDVSSKPTVMKTMFAGIAIGMLIFAASARGQENLVGYWSFDRMAGDTLFDESGNANHGTNFGGELIQGVQGMALSFDGNGSYARLSGSGAEPPPQLSELGKGSISLWFKVNHIPTDYGIAPVFYYGTQEKCEFFDAANKGLIIELGHSPIHPGSERVYFTIWKNGCTYPSFCYDSRDAIPENEWHHLVVVVGEDYNTGYLNGKEMVNRRYNFGNSNFSQFFEDALAHERLWLGKGHWDETTQFYDGAIDELRIYNRPLHKSEIKELQNGGSIPTRVDGSGEKDSRIRISPNPASDRIHYSVQGFGKRLTALELTDITGKRIHRYTQVPDQGSIDISGLTEGIYFIGFYGKTRRYQKRILVR